MGTVFETRVSTRIVTGISFPCGTLPARMTCTWVIPVVELNTAGSVPQGNEIPVTIRVETRVSNTVPIQVRAN